MRNDYCTGYLEHGLFSKLRGTKKKNAKYVARVGEPGNYRYFYSLKEYAAYLKGKAKDAWKNKEKIATDTLNKGVNKVEGAYNKLVKDNKYVSDDNNYEKKIAQVKNTKEWKDIVARKDPEYVYKDKEGNTQYDVDSYLAKKKHPGLDIADDIVSGRPVTINKVEKDSAVAGALDYGKTYVTLAALGTKFLIEKFKFSQGSYKEEKEAAIDAYYDNKAKIETQAKLASENKEVYQELAKEGADYISKALNEYGNAQTVENLSSVKSHVSDADYEALQKDYEALQRELDRLKKQNA